MTLVDPVPNSPLGELSPELTAVRAVVAGDIQAFEALMRRHNRMVFRTVRSITRSDEEAEDVAQEAWLAAYRNLAQFEGRAAFSTWLIRIALRIASARTRTQLRFEPLDDVDQTTMDHASDGPAAALERAEAARTLERALDDLPVEYRVVLMLRDVEQRSTRETAEALGLSEQNVRVRLHRSRAALRQRLDTHCQGRLEDVFAFDGQRCDRLVHAVLARASSEAAVPRRSFGETHSR